MEHSAPKPTQQDFEDMQRYLAAHPCSTQFVRLADLYLQDGMPATALKTAEAGFANHPEHAGALLVAAKASILLRRYNDARRHLEQLLVVAPGSAMAASLLNELKSLELRFPPSSSPIQMDSGSTGASLEAWTSRQRKRWSWEDNLIGGDTVFAPELTDEPMDVQDIAPPQEDQSDDTVHDLELLAERLQGARIPPVREQAGEEFPQEIQPDPDIRAVQSRPVTETLAQIYLQQGRYSEAIAAYKELRDRHPERTYELTLRLIEIERLATTETDNPPVPPAQ